MPTRRALEVFDNRPIQIFVAKSGEDPAGWAVPVERVLAVFKITDFLGRFSERVASIDYRHKFPASGSSVSRTKSLWFKFVIKSSTAAFQNRRQILGEHGPGDHRVAPCLLGPLLQLRLHV